jgi:hypothetical protein
MLESIKPETASLWSSAGHFESGHCSEIMSNDACERGCTGVVVDAGLKMGVDLRKGITVSEVYRKHGRF